MVNGQSDLFLLSNVEKELTAASCFFHVGVAYAAAMSEACAGFLFGTSFSAILDVVEYFLALTREENVGPAGKEIVPKVSSGFWGDFLLYKHTRQRLNSTWSDLNVISYGHA